MRALRGNWVQCGRKGFHEVRMRCKTNHNIKFAYTNKTTDLFPEGHPLRVYQVIEKDFFNNSILSLPLCLSTISTLCFILRVSRVSWDRTKNKVSKQLGVGTKHRIRLFFLANAVVLVCRHACSFTYEIPPRMYYRHWVVLTMTGHVSSVEILLLWWDTMTKSNLGVERIFSAYLKSIVKRSSERTSARTWSRKHTAMLFTGQWTFL